MSRQVVIGIVTVAVTSLAVAQEAEEQRWDQEGDSDRQLELRYQQLELEAREAELDFQRQMHKLEIEEQRQVLEQRHDGGGGAVFLAFCVVVNILLTIWVYQDIRKRNADAGLWIAITLLTGFLGALLYALVRLGDVRQEGTSTQ